MTKWPLCDNGKAGWCCYELEILELNPKRSNNNPEPGRARFQSPFLFLQMHYNPFHPLGNEQGGNDPRVTELNSLGLPFCMKQQGRIHSNNITQYICLTYKYIGLFKSKIKNLVSFQSFAKNFSKISRSSSYSFYKFYICPDFSTRYKFSES